MKTPKMPTSGIMSYSKASVPSLLIAALGIAGECIRSIKMKDSLFGEDAISDNVLYNWLSNKLLPKKG